MICTIQFEHTGDAYTLKGAVQDFDRNPLEVWFNYTQVNEEYLAFESILNEKNLEDLRVICQIYSSIYNCSLIIFCTCCLLKNVQSAITGR